MQEINVQELLRQHEEELRRAGLVPTLPNIPEQNNMLTNEGEPISIEEAERRGFVRTDASGRPERPNRYIMDEAGSMPSEYIRTVYPRMGTIHDASNYVSTGITTSGSSTITGTAGELHTPGVDGQEFQAQLSSDAIHPVSPSENPGLWQQMSNATTIAYDRSSFTREEFVNSMGQMFYQNRGNITTTMQPQDHILRSRRAGGNTRRPQATLPASPQILKRILL